MKPYKGDDVEYRGYLIKNDKKNLELKVFDGNGNYIFKRDNYNHGSLTGIKCEIDALIARYGAIT